MSVLSWMGSQRRRLHAWAWPHGGEPVLLRRVGVLLDICTLLFPYIAMVFVTRTLSVASEPDLLRLALLASVEVFLASTPVLLRFTGRLNLGIVLVMTPCIVGATAISVLTGGLSAPVVPILVVTPTLATLAFGRDVGRVTLAVVMVLFLGLGLLDLLDWLVQDDSGTRVAVQVVTTLAASAFVFFVVDSYETRERVSRLELEQRERLAALGTLAAGVAHEINNPLAVIRLNTELLSEGGGLGEADRALLLDMLDASRRIGSIVEDLHVYSRVDAPTMEAVRLADALGQAVRLCRARTGAEHPIELSFASDLWVVSHEGRLVQVLVNLLVNACLAVDDAPVARVRVSARAEQYQCIISVEDSGPGFPEQNRDRLLEPFYTTRKTGQGTGLGLYLVHVIVENHGGTMEIGESEALGGARVSFSFPLAEPTLTSRDASALDITIDGEPAEETGEITVPQAGPLHVLVVDDDPMVSRAVGRVLQGNRVSRAQNGREALAILQDGRLPDVVLLDVVMPELTGPQVYEALQDQRPEALDRIAFLTGGAVNQEMAHFLDRVTCPVLHKPASAELLLATVRELSLQRR